MSTHPRQTTNFATSSIMNISNVLAFTASVMGAPHLYGMTAPYVVRMLGDNYGTEYIGLFDLMWMILTFLLVFFPARAFFYVALMTLASGILVRLV